MYLDNYLNDFMNSNKSINKLSKESVTYRAFYHYWREKLLERVMRLFIWDGTGEVPPKEIEITLAINGHVGISKLKNELTAFNGSFYGPTKYYDEFTNYNIYCPLYSGSRTIGKDIVVINNDTLRNPTLPLIHHYAVMLAHNEVTLCDVLINARDAGGVPVVSNEIQKKSVAAYQTNLFNGKFDSVTDPAFLGIQFAGSDKHTSQSIMDIWEVREKLLKSFYSDIGVRSAFEKRSNAVESEVEADTSLLLLNLSDMLKFRQIGCEEVNAMYGTNWTVRIADEVQYGLENNPEERGDNSEDSE